MQFNKPGALRERVILHALASPDQQSMDDALAAEGYEPHLCLETCDLMTALADGVGVLVVDEQILTPELYGYLKRYIDSQPPWSDLPVLILTEEDTDTTSAHRVDGLGNVTLLSRPFRAGAFLSAIRSAFRARRKQYEIAGHLSERDHLLHQVRDSERIYRGIGETIRYGIWVSDPEGRFLYVSHSMLDLLGRTQDQVTAEGLLAFVHPDERQQVAKQWRETVRNGGAWDVVTQVQGADGHYHPILARGGPIRGDHNEVVCWAGINLDISREKNTEEALRQANEALHNTNEELERLLYVAMHDLREPLRNIVLNTQIFERRYRGKLDERADEVIGMLNGSARRMEALIHDLTIYAKIFRVESESSAEVATADVLQKVVSMMHPAIAAIGAEVTWDKLPVVAVHDSHLEQLFYNLLDNALKYHGDENPCVHVSATLDEAESPPSWHFRVQDNGIGIDPAYTSQIFGLFWRLHTESEYPGTGIGLPICQRIIEKYGGRIWVSSTPGAGSTFHFTLPAAA